MFSFSTSGRIHVQCVGGRLVTPATMPPFPSPAGTVITDKLVVCRNFCRGEFDPVFDSPDVRKYIVVDSTPTHELRVWPVALATSVL